VSLSGLVLAVEPQLTATPRDAFAGLLPVVPTTQREFGAGDSVRGFLRVYWGGDRAALPITVDARIADANNATVFERRTVVLPEAPTSPRSADVEVALPLAGRPPGEYLLTIEASAPGQATMRRDARFWIR
jgi:hypothetical protein